MKPWAETAAGSTAPLGACPDSADRPPPAARAADNVRDLIRGAAATAAPQAQDDATAAARPSRARRAAGTARAAAAPAEEAGR